MQALAKLVKNGDEHAVDVLIECLRDPDPCVRYSNPCHEIGIATISNGCKYMNSVKMCGPQHAKTMVKMCGPQNGKNMKNVNYEKQMNFLKFRNIKILDFGNLKNSILHFFV